MSQRPVEDIYGVSPLQHGMLFESVLDPSSTSYVTQIPLALRGPLHVDALEACWRALVSRHPILRTGFAWEGLEAPLQLVHTAGRVSMSVARVRLDHLPEDERHAAVDAWLAEDAKRPFSLARPPLMRVALLQLGPEHHVQVWTHHHLILDGWSVALLLGELLSSYDQLRGSDASGPDLLEALASEIRAGTTAPPFREFIRWLATRPSEKRLHFWQQRLARYDTLTPLPRPAHPGSRGGFVEARIELSRSESDHLREWASTERVTLNSLVQGAWALVLARHAGVERVAFGVTSSGRPHEIVGVEAMVGPMITTLPMVLEIGSELRASDWIREIQQANVAAREYEHTPLAELRDACGLEPGVPLFESLIVFDNYPVDVDQLSQTAGLTLGAHHPAPDSEAAGFAARRNHYPTTLVVFPGDEIWLMLACDSTRVQHEAIAPLLAELRRLLGELTRADLRVRDAGRPSAQQAARLLARNDGVYSSDRASDPATEQIPTSPADLDLSMDARNATTLLQRVEATARTTPESCAVEDATGARLSYAELVGCADLLAASLRALGVRAGDRVLLDVGRRVEWMIAALASWRLGAAYVPMDPSLPEGRRRLLESRAQAAARVTRATDVESSGDLPSIEVDLATLLDSLQEGGGHGAASMPARDTGETPLAAVAYRLFTSGSTGEPKAVDVPHESLACYLDAVIARLAPEPKGRFAGVSSLAADLGLTSVFGALWCGGTAWLIDEPLALDPDGLEELFERTGRPQVCKVTPSQLRVWLAARFPAALLPSELLVLGGEALHYGLVQQIRALAPELRIVNHYGPTETTVGVCTYEIPRDPHVAEMDPRRAVPLGVPLRSAALYVCDPSDAARGLAPDGAHGELLIGGQSLALGYAESPRETALRFAPDPFAALPTEQARTGARLYRTGDLVCWNQDGLLEFRGRTDDQISVHGVRIELGEVEAALRSLPEVTSAAARVRTDPVSDEPRLVAWVVANPLHEPGAAPRDWRAELATKLPAPMLPVRICEVDAFPLGPSGKLDVRALPDPFAVEKVRGSEACGDDEHQMLAIWRDVLKRDDCEVEDDFFTLGGDSILGLQIVARARRSGLSLQPRDLFEHPSVRAVCEHLRSTSVPAMGAQSGLQGEAALEAEASSLPAHGEIALLPIQRWFFARKLLDPHHFNQALWVTLPENASAPQVEAALASLRQRHPALHARFVESDGRFVQTWDPATTDGAPAELAPCVEVLDAAALRDPATFRGHLSRLQASLDLASGELVRALYVPSERVGELLSALAAPELQRTPSTPLLLWIVHHLAVDAVSWFLLIGELEAALANTTEQDTRARAEGLASWAGHLTSEATCRAFTAQSSYWSDIPRFELPVDHPNGANTIGELSEIVVSLDAEHTRALYAGGRDDARVDEILLCAIGRTLARFADSRDVVIDMESHGRADPEGRFDLATCVGWFTCRYPIVLRDIHPGASAEDAALDEHLASVQATLRGVPDEGLGYGVLRYSDRDDPSSRLPDVVPPVSYNHLGGFDDAKALERPGSESGVRILPLEVADLRSSRGARSQLIDITAHVRDGRLKLRWSYSRALHEAASIDRLARDTERELERLIARVRRPPAHAPRAASQQPTRFALSPLQQGLLFHTVYDPSDPAYVNQLSIDLRGPLDVDALARAWQALAQRHAILRTRFEWRAGSEPMQLVEPEVQVPLRLEDWSDLDPGDLGGETHDTRWRELREQTVQRGFDLERAPLMRIDVVRTAPERHRLCWTRHHLLMDGWSSSRALFELLSLYREEHTRQPASLPPVRPFSDYIDWLARTNAGYHARDRSARFWSRTLAPLTRSSMLADVVEPPAGPPRERFGNVQYTLPPDLVRRVRELASAERVTVATVLHGAFALLLSRHLGTRHIAHGLTVAGRPADLPDVEGILGLFINTLPACVDVDPARSCGDWLRSLQAQNIELREHEHEPLNEILRHSPLERGAPLFDCLLVLENYPRSPTIELDGLGFHAVEQPVRTHYALTWVISPEALGDPETRAKRGTETRRDEAQHLETQRIEVGFDARRISASHIERMLDHFERILHQLAMDSDTEFDTDLDTSSEDQHEARALRALKSSTLRLGAVNPFSPHETATLLKLARSGAAVERHPSNHSSLPLVHERFLAWSSAQPDAIAVIAGDLGLRYRELAERTQLLAEQIHRVLRAQPKDSRELRVASCLPRDERLVVAFLASLRAGVTYVPLDITHPPARLAYVLDDANVALLLTSSELRGRFAKDLPILELGPGGTLPGCDQPRTPDPIPGQPVVAPSASGSSLSGSELSGRELSGREGATATELAGRTPHPEQLAYVIYTSGSTGAPKGVGVSHANLAALFAATDAHFDFEPGDVWSLFHSPAFDFSVWEIFGALTSGGRVVVVPQEARADASTLASLLEEHGITVLSQTPAAFDAFLHHLETRVLSSSDGATIEPLPALRFIVFGGDTLDLERLAPWFEQSSGATRLVNMYGITETTVHVTFLEISQDALRPLPSPIGRPLDHLQLYLLDDQGQPVPLGCSGEIYVGGTGLSRGYLGRPSLTAARFVPNPFPGPVPELSDAASGTRLYRTGDLARFELDSSAAGDAVRDPSENARLVYLGRCDRQVQLRGYRIELAEIERALEELPGVARSLVELRETPNAHLVAYVVRTPEGIVARDSIAHETWRSALRERIPAYMIPSRFVPLVEFPLTVNGKLDRVALRELDSETGAGETVEPEGELENALQKVWRRLLGTSHFGVTSDFFALGGDSILAMRLSGELQRRGLEVEPRDLFESPTIRQLAARLTAARPNAARLTASAQIEMGVQQRTVADASGAELRHQALRHQADKKEFPLSPTQERMWFLQRLDPGASTYHVPFAVQVDERLDPALLRDALDLLVARHPILRTRIVERDGEAAQEVLDVDRVPSAFVEPPRGTGPVSTERLLTDPQLRELLDTPFDLSVPPLLRASLRSSAVENSATESSAAERSVLVLVAHHVIVDAWSLGVLLRELLELYESARDGRVADLPELRLSYGDFALWQRERLERGELAHQLEYWRTQLADLEPLKLPLRPGARSMGPHPSGRHSFELEARDVAALDLQASRLGATRFMWIVAAVQSFLSRYCGQRDLALGVPALQRVHPDLAPVLGCFLNTLVLRGQIEPADSFDGLLARTRDLAREAYAHQDYPFERLVSELGIERTHEHEPLFDVQLVLQSARFVRPESVRQGSTSGPTQSRSNLTPISLPPASEKLPLTIFIEANDSDGPVGPARSSGSELSANVAPAGAEALRVTFAYGTTCFDERTIVRMTQLFRHWVSQLAARSDAALSSIALLDPEASSELLALSRGPGSSAATTPRALHVRFEEQARLTPDRVAVIAAGHELSFAALDQRANQLSWRLHTLGVRRGDVVGLCLDRSLDLSVAIFGVLKAGAAYLPLDTEAPTAHTHRLLRDAGARAIIVQARHASAIPLQQGAVQQDADRQDGQAGVLLPHVLIDSETSGLERESSEPPRLPWHPDDIAYVLYTSGSTGTPKGVQVPHAGVYNRVRWHHRFASEAPVRVLQKTPYTFDVSMWELLWPPLYGHTLVYAAPGSHRDPLAIAAQIERDAITHVHFVPSMLQAFLEASPGSYCDTVRHISCSGEALPPDLAYACRREIDAQLHNLYGPTEASIEVSSWTYPEPESHRDSNSREDSLAREHSVPAEIAVLPAIPIGTPIDQVELWVLDEELGLVAPGTVGELFIGGIALARGYAGRPAWTADRFVPHPHAVQPGARLYRTGDRVRRSEDGELYYLGRSDAQIKLRGQRIEPGEIEHQLRLEAGVRDAVVLLHQSNSAKAELVAYLARERELDLAGIRAALITRLPGHMIPSRFLQLDELPLTSSGKTDRRALAQLATDPDSEAAPLLAPTSAPERAREAQLCLLWSELLERPVGIDDNLFELGAHSLSAARFVARLHERYALAIGLRDVFEHPSVRGMATCVRPSERSGIRLHALPRTPDRAFPLSSAQQRFWFLDRLQPGLATYHVPIAVELIGELDVPALQRALDALVERHEILRTTYPARDGVPYQLPAETLEVALEQQALPPAAPGDSGAREFWIRERLSERARVPFDLARGPLVRASLWRPSPDPSPEVSPETNTDASSDSPRERSVFLLELHHIASDAWSIGILLRDLAALYAVEISQEQAPPAPLPLQYADFATWQQQQLDTGTLERQVSYWRSRLEALPSLELPSDRPRRPERSHHGARITWRVAPETAHDLERFARERGATPYMLLLAAYQAVLGRFAGQHDFGIGSPLAERPASELEDLVGCFLNTIVFRAELSDDPSFEELLARTRRQVLESWAHADVPFEHLVDVLRPPRDPARTPFFQAMLVMQNAPLPEISTRSSDTTGLSLRPLAVDTHSARFDLTLSAQPTPGGLELALEYRTDLFDRPRMEGMVAAFDGLLAHALRDPSTRISELALCSDDQCLHWAARAYRPHRDGAARLTHHGVHEHIARVAAARPEAQALVAGSDSWSYADLDSRANRWARALRAAGVANEARVAIQLERSPEWIAAALAIWKAGGAFVPLEPDLPPARTRELVTSTQARICITRALVHAEVAEPRPEVPHPSGKTHDHPRYLTLDQLDLADDASPLAGRAQPHQLAYVMHTSGSTGTPKGVAVEHHSILDLVSDASYVRLSDATRMLHAAPPAFDAATLEIWGPLVNGGTCVILPAGLPTAAALRQALGSGKVDTAWLTASLFNSLVDEDVSALTGLRQLLVGGEALSSPHIARAQHELPGLQIHNGYGPTENTTFSCTHGIGALAHPLQEIPIGRPLAGRSAYVLDGAMRPVPPGVLGELYVGGGGLARGYLGQARITAERFVPDPFGRPEPGARLYRTGDLARLAPDGSILFVGRRDGQVKLRGHRIELGEIEARLRTLPGVSEAAVVLAPRASQLVAFVRGKPEAALDAAELRSQLTEELPRWMVPQQIVPLDDFPYTHSGKLDRRALELRTASIAELGARPPHVAPRDKSEARLAELWSELLATSGIGVHDDFFELGGHSLLATQLVARIEREFARTLSVEAIFDTPTLEALAKRLAADPQVDSESSASGASMSGDPGDSDPGPSDGTATSATAKDATIKKRTRRKRGGRKLDAEVHR